MNSIVPIEDAFSHVYLVDLSPSLCEIARERVRRMGWTNVSVVCEDARKFRPQETEAEVITMSYSLSMIPDYYSVVDSLTKLLSPDGIIGVCDFYVQSIVDVSSRTYTGGTFNRHVNWLGRMFWRAWFDADRVNLDGGRRDYLEYKFGTILSASDRNYLLGGIPYYIFLGCPTEISNPFGRTQDVVDKLDAALTESPYLSPKDYQQALSEAADDTSLVRSKAYESAVVNLTAKLPLPSTFYQNHHWRIYYNDLLQKHLQFNGEYIYAFNWEDPKVDRQLLNINKDDVILAITSAGDNILDYLLESPRRIHAVDLNPNQNHLLELKIAAFTALPHSDIWALFGQGHHSNFRSLLIHKLSPHLSSPAFQFWLTNHKNLSSFSSGGLYFTGSSRHALKLIRTLFRLSGLTSTVRTICTVSTLAEQTDLWPPIRRVLLSWPLHRLLIASEWWAWRAAGVPKTQRDMIVQDYIERTTQTHTTNQTHTSSKPPRPSHPQQPTLPSSSTSAHTAGSAIYTYLLSTFDPLIRTTLLSTQNYFYHLCLLGHYSPHCSPRYLSPKSHSRLSSPPAFSNLRIHTDELLEVISRMAPSSLTIAIIMDSMDWFDAHTEQGRKDAEGQVKALWTVLKEKKGRVLLRSAAVRPWYVGVFERGGFRARCVGRRDVEGVVLDRVNMYASAWICTKVEMKGGDGKGEGNGEDMLEI